MKNFFALLSRVVRLVAREARHDDCLRANRVNEPAPRLGFWRAVVS